MYVNFNGTRFVERESPLARCPKARCRRAGACAPHPPGHPCMRHYETQDALKWRISRKLEKLAREHPYTGPPLSDEETDRMLAILKQGLVEREEEHFAEMRRKAQAAAEAPSAARAAARSGSPSRPRGRGRKGRPQAVSPSG
jgi:hypothetical protein